jgi:hypothetical protein
VAGTSQHDLHLSVLVVGEIRHGVELLRRRGNHEQAESIEEWLVSLERQFGDRLIPISVAVADRWGGSTRSGRCRSSTG